MSDEVTVTFKLEATDPADSTGVTEDDFNAIVNGVAALGGYDVEITKA